MLKLSDLTLKYGTPYFLSSGKHIHGPRKGSIQHVSINLPQAGYRCDGDIFEVIDNRLKKAFEVLLLKKKVMCMNLDGNLLPFLKQKAAGLRYFNPANQRYNISYTGLNELVRLQTGSDLRSKAGLTFGLKVVKSMMRTVDGFRRESELDFVLSGSPKGVCYTSFAALDAVRFGLRAQVNGSANAYYSKSHYISGKTLSEKLRLEGRFNRLISGRTLTHIRLAEGVQDREGLSNLIGKLLESDEVNYFTFSRALTVCGRCGFSKPMVAGKCPKCRSRLVSVWSRDTGHLQNTRNWSLSQRQSYVDEMRYDLRGAGVRLPTKDRQLVMKY